MGHGHCQICVGRFYCIYTECVENVVLLLAVTVYIKATYCMGLQIFLIFIQTSVLIDSLYFVYKLSSFNKVNRQLSLYF